MITIEDDFDYSDEWRELEGDRRPEVEPSVEPSVLEEDCE